MRCGAPSSLAGKVPAGVEDAGFFGDTICFTIMASVVGIRTRHPPKRAGRNSLPPEKKKEKQRLVPTLLLPHKILLELSVTSEIYRPEKADRGRP